MTKIELIASEVIEISTAYNNLVYTIRYKSKLDGDVYRTVIMCMCDCGTAITKDTDDVDLALLNQTCAVEYVKETVRKFEKEKRDRAH